MSTVLITGSAGLIGSESVSFYSKKKFDIVGIDNNFRKFFFGEEASISWKLDELKEKNKNYAHFDIDIRNNNELTKIFKKYNKDISLIIHCAAQPSHDWSIKDPQLDFSINANGTLNLLENTRKYSSNAVFIFCSTNKVYGDSPNKLPLIELSKRWEIEDSHTYFLGIDEKMSVDSSIHSLFGASKLSADILVQEYGKYFNLKTTCFRGGCLTGPDHSGAMLHGFLSYLMKCSILKKKYIINGYKGKQVRDNIHSHDLVQAFDLVFNKPNFGEVFNIGGGREINCSILEAIDICNNISGNQLEIEFSDIPRIGDHIWYISNLKKFKNFYPNWKFKYNLEKILKEIFDYQKNRILK